MVFSKLQDSLKEKEERFLKYLEIYWKSQGKKFRRASKEEDIKQGIDVYLDDQPFDVKASRENHRGEYPLTAFKRIYKANEYEWYSPLTRHPEIPYLYSVEQEDRFVVFGIKKSDILDNLDNLAIHKSEIDGNLNMNVDILKIADKYFMMPYFFCIVKTICPNLNL